MEKITALGKWLFILPFSMYIILPLTKPETGASFVPAWIPAPLFWNYFSGVCILAFMISCMIRKYDKLATLLMALYVVLMIFLVHVPRAATSENDLLNIFRNTMVTGALLIYAQYVAQDKRVVG
ncbi:MAG: hypothetical protein WCR52_19525 [Bacteroidota bacterium]